MVEVNAEPAVADVDALATSGKKLAMHIVAAKPEYLAPGDVPADIVAKEQAIFK